MVLNFKNTKKIENMKGRMAEEVAIFGVVEGNKILRGGSLETIIQWVTFQSPSNYFSLFYYI